MSMTTNSRVTHAAGALTIAAILGIGLAAQGTTQQTQGRGGAAGGATGQQVGVPAQTPARDTQTQAQKPSTGVISGVVIVEGLGTPVRRARISLTAPELRGGRTTITNDQGQFSFTALPAGRFQVTASKAGYVDIPFGAKKAGRPGTPIQLADGGKMEKANINLPKGSVLTGVVVDDNGEPTPRTQVRAFRYVIRTGERTLQQAGTDQTDDRGMYRIYGLQPGDYLVSAIPQNYNIGDLRQTLQAEIESLMQQVQSGPLGAALGAAQAAQAAAGGAGGGGRGGGMGGGRGGGAGVAGIDVNQILGGGGRGGGNPAMDRLQQLQDQLSGQEGQQTTTYAPVYYPGTATPSTAQTVTLTVAEERNGVDFRLMLVPTAKIEGTVHSADGTLPQGTQLSLISLDQGDTPPVPGATTNTTRVTQDGSFSFRDIPPGQYRVMARGAIRAQDPNAPAGAAGQQQAGAGGRGGQGPGGRGMGGPGMISQVLWGSADVNVNGEDVKGVAVSLQEGMTVTGRIVFDSSSALPPADLSAARVNLSPRGAQQSAMDIGGVPPATVDASGRFTIKGVVPGKYSITAAIAGGGARGGAAGAAGGGGGRGGATGAATGATTQWVLKAAVAGGKDALDFGLVVEPNQDVTATVTFGDKTQEVSGTIQDTQGNPTSDYTIVIFAAEKGYWVPQARRINAVRPGTDGKFTFRNLPVGEYRLTAVTDAEPGEWFDPNFLEQLFNVSIPVSLREGEKKTQDIKVAGGGH